MFSIKLKINSKSRLFYLKYDVLKLREKINMQDIMPVLSIITPCYNHGIYLDEMLASVNDFHWPFKIEHIIINDGSTDAYTLKKLHELSGNIAVKVINQENQGLAKARNNAISFATGKYILPLDSDNKIFPEIFLKAVRILDNDSSVDIIYTDAYFFGEKKGLWKVDNFDISTMLFTNQFDACTLIRKEIFNKFGGYDANMPAMGHEDWELWIRLGLNGCKFYHLTEPGFGYRVAANSMVNIASTPNWKNNRKYIFLKHASMISEVYDHIYFEKEQYKKEYNASKNIKHYFFQKLKSFYYS